MLCITDIFIDWNRIRACESVELLRMPPNGRLLGIENGNNGSLRLVYDDGKSLTECSMSVLECDRQPRPQEHTMDQRQRQDLDRYITGNYGEDQFKRDKDSAPVPAALSLLTDAIETCPYLKDWLEVEDVVRDEDLNVTYFRAREVKDEDDIVVPGKLEWVEINADRVRQAARKLITGEVSIGRDIAAQFVGKEEDWDYDSVGVDCIIQVIVLGEVKYG